MFTSPSHGFLLLSHGYCCWLVFGYICFSPTELSSKHLGIFRSGQIYSIHPCRALSHQSHHRSFCFLDFCKYLLEEPTGYHELIDYDLEDVTPYRSQFDIISDLH